ncbi:MAG: pyrroline-5-carboxylate reductase [Rhodothermaceae bacterium]|nr:pyrroline-5-carboxylate reductase [Rhodothermaceae bacterium]MXZ58243.1 pyrroline-5-carboxylate reductase [Rhodothermaceae bacterium]MYB91192.1 pyrroline-5-carboxylate reductase [Rhodothermaceae bacterium]MYD66739.1 pyrroline-5-carboxylate reductase [Rhodothermaceae bacterium]MYG43979.1 pyrroline-5-carboxylate reductase [Rhodothermaceae bacterium]
MSLSHQTIAVIGAGNIGRALVGGLISGGHLDPSRVRVTRRNPNGLEILHRKLPGVSAGVDNKAAVKDASIIVLAVKPTNWLSVAEEIREFVNPGTLIVSVLAGLTTDRIAKEFPDHQPVVRTMPNTPMTVFKGATAICAGASASVEHVELVREMFEAVGRVERVPEYLMDAVTGLSGSGPAYVYMLIEALTDAGVKQGLPRSTAFRLTKQTVLGAAQLADQTDKHPAILRDEVTTPGGTSISAIAELEQHGLRTMFIHAVATATERSKELSGN